MEFEVLGILFSAIVAIGIAIYQVKTAKKKSIDNRKSNSHQEIWSALTHMRFYYDTGMQTELETFGTLTMQPILEFRNVVSMSKPNIEIELYNELEKFYQKISLETNVKLFDPMKMYLAKKDKLLPNELGKIETEINSNRIKIKNEIQNYMKSKRDIWE